MKPDAIYAKITNALDSAYASEDQRNLFKPLLDELLAETAAAALSGTGKTAFQAALKFAKATAKEMNKKGRPQLAGAWTDEKTGKQYICDTFTLIEYDTPMAGLPQAEYFGQRPLKPEEIIKPRTFTGSLPDVARLRAAYATDKTAYGAMAKDHYTALIYDDHIPAYFDTQRLADAIECMQSQTLQYDKSGVTPITITGKLGQTLVCPCRVEHPDETCYEIQRYSV